jgi:hypothetical protein
MTAPNGRSDRRITKEVAVELARPDASQLREMAIAQNVSARGMRVASEDGWLPGDRVLLSCPESGVRTQARVVSFIVSAWKTTGLLSVWNFWPRWENGPSRISSSRVSRS